MRCIRLLSEADGLGDLSLEELGDVQVTTVSRGAQSVGEAPAAIYVISADDIERAGIRCIPIRCGPGCAKAGQRAIG